MIKPMLAHKYKPAKVSYPCFVQPKLNGVRGVYVTASTRDPAYFQSRYGEIWNEPTVAHSLSCLTRLKFHLDGEFYRHGMSLQNINSRIGVVRNGAHVERDLISFHMFDVIVDVPFHKRHLIMCKLMEDYIDELHVRMVPTVEVSSESEAEYFYNQWKNQQGYEGMMYRDADAPYGFAHRCGNKDNRWNYLLKRKEMLDIQATIIGFQEMICGTTGDPKGTLGAFELRYSNGAEGTAGSGLTNEQRAAYWALGEEKMKGVQVRVNYEMLSDSNIPLKPIIDLVDYVL